MGSHPTLAHHQLANEAHELDPDDRIPDHHRPAGVAGRGRGGAPAARRW